MKLHVIFLIAIAVLFSACQRSSSKTSTGVIISQTEESSVKQDTLFSAASSEISCPKCGFKKMEIMPTDACLLKYRCGSCTAELLPKEGDCCVFCTYGTVKCPSKQ